jgi:hypothetical protein
VRLHRDPERHAFISRQASNLILNLQETLAGRAALTSTPPNLGIDLHGACNVKPPCVYCEWDFSKALEGDHVDVPFTSDTLREWGPYFDNAVNLINCSIGEPFMMKNLDELFGIFGNTGKVLQMTTNGQILTDRNIQKLLGLPIDLYLSLDAASPQTYSQLRNNTFDRILGNLRRLIAAKGGRGKPPFVHLVFMPMQCNLHELDDFVHLCADLGVDRMVLRPLNYSDSIALDWTRAGHRFEYQKELLPFDALIRASGRALRLAERLGVDLADQMDFGGGMREQFKNEFDRGMREADAAWEAKQFAGAPHRRPRRPSVAVTPSEAAVALSTATSPGAAPVPPAATAAAGSPAPLPSLGQTPRAASSRAVEEPHILRRGILPCCYGGAPIAKTEEHDAAWNSPTLQSIRASWRRVASSIVRSHPPARSCASRNTPSR